MLWNVSFDCIFYGGTSVRRIFSNTSPPLWKFQLSFTHFFKFLGLTEPPTPQEIPIPSVGGVWIFSGTAHLISIILIRRNTRSRVIWQLDVSNMFNGIENGGGWLGTACLTLTDLWNGWSWSIIQRKMKSRMGIAERTAS